MEMAARGLWLWAVFAVSLEDILRVYRGLGEGTLDDGSSPPGLA